jgi:hypothetical protein
LLIEGSSQVEMWIFFEKMNGFESHFVRPKQNIPLLGILPSSKSLQSG